MTAAEIRAQFLKFFQERGHQVVPSSSLVPADDPTLLFTNAGMNQFKDVFLGRERRSYTRAVSVQKCVRAGGKHNDLDMVGRTARHQTFFEMLGNWSFGDYFKQDAIRYAWEFVTEVLKLPPDRIWVTVFKDDEEAYQLWQSLAHLPPERIVRLGEHDNFWEMAETGPCGPDTELFIDRGAEYACGPECGIGRCECDRFEEFWNLVFMQYDRARDGTLTPLPMPCVDTGMGLERITAITERVLSNFETDLLWPLIRATEELAGGRYQPGEDGLPYRVIADHVRAVTMLLADGVLFSNTDRGYVMRRILRRAVRYGRILGLQEPFLYRLVPVVGDILGDAYPEVRQGQPTIMATIQAEELRFQETLESGLKLLADRLEAASVTGVMRGDDAFVLYDTYGFPFDLTEDAARERGIVVDRTAFDAAMQQQRERARQGRPVDKVALPDLPASTFVGYQTLTAKSPLRALVVGGESAREAGEGDAVAFYCERTPFYPEGGGQVGDRGQATGGEGHVRVTDTQKMNGAIWHFGIVQSGEIRLGDEMALDVDAGRRQGAMRNHTGTHLLHAALRQVLGEGARQTGSLVAPERLRFDFSHPVPMTPEELGAVEDLVNRWILQDLSVEVVETSIDQARSRGALAFFGEKYGEQVRMIDIAGASTELCGGTHCQHTGQIGSLYITEETGIGSGMRRIEAVTGWGALQWARDQERRLREAARLLKVAPSELRTRVEELLARARDLERLQEERQREALVLRAQALQSAVEEQDGLRLMVHQVDAEDPLSLRELLDYVRDAADVVVLGAAGENRAFLLVYCAATIRSRGLHAGRLIQQMAPLVGGGGGGRPDLAQAGGKRPEGVADALALAKSAIVEAIRQDIRASGAK